MYQGYWNCRPQGSFLQPHTVLAAVCNLNRCPRNQENKACLLLKDPLFFFSRTSFSHQQINGLDIKLFTNCIKTYHSIYWNKLTSKKLSEEWCHNNSSNSWTSTEVQNDYQAKVLILNKYNTKWKNTLLYLRIIMLLNHYRSHNYFS